MEIILLTIILAPLAASLLNYLFYIKKGWLSIAASIVSLAASLFLVFFIKASVPSQYYYSGFPNQPYYIRANISSIVLACIVSFIALCIFIYAEHYMQKEKGKTWFWGGISLFLSGMLLLVFAGDWILFITAWEIMGFSSYLLIATWHENEEARKGAIKAFMLTRFTDMFLYAGVFAMVLHFGNINIVEATGQQLSTLAGIFLLIAVMGKSAQVPFQSWLSGAMAGPTPVSALLHSATMVAAGAILLFKVYPLLNQDVLFITGLVGGVTVLLTGLTAITATDVKQLLAASTSSQLGFMLLAVGAGSPDAAFAHWIAHAFMKASLFMGAGIFQHVYHSTSFADIQGAGKKLKAALTGFTIAAMGLSGIPPLIGFWSKDGILAATEKSAPDKIFFWIAVAGAFFTAVYMGKAIKRLWVGQNVNHSVPDLKYMLTGLFFLVFFIIAGGFFLEPVVRFAGYKIPTNSISKIAGITAAIAGLAAAWYVKESWFRTRWWSTVRENYTIAGGYKNLVAEPMLKCAAFFDKVDVMLLRFVQKTGKGFLNIARLAKSTDAGLNHIVDAVGNIGIGVSNSSRSFEEKGVEAGVYGVSSAVQESGKWGRKLQTGLVHKELVITIAGLLILIFILIVMITHG